MSVEMPRVSNKFINYIYSRMIYGTTQLIVIHDMTLWQHAYTRQQILAWGKSVWSRKSRNLRTQCSSCGAHQTHEVCQRFLELCTWFFDAPCTWSTLNIDSLRISDMKSAHKHKHALPNSARNASHYAVSELYQRQNHRGGKNSKHDLWLEAVVLQGCWRKEGTQLIFHFFMHHACWCALCTCHIYFIFLNHSGKVACSVAPGTHHGDGAAFQMLLSHERKTVLFLLLTCKKETLLGQLSCRNMAQRWNRVHLCWPAAVWIPPRLLSYCENLPLLRLFLFQQNAAEKFEFQLLRRSSVTNQQCFYQIRFHSIASFCTDMSYNFFWIRDPSFHPFNHCFIWSSIHSFTHPSINLSCSPYILFMHATVCLPV